MMSLSCVGASDIGENTTMALDGQDITSEIYVDVHGANANNGTQVSPVMTIDKAISMASDNDTIYLSDGEFAGAGNTKLTIDKSLTFIGSDNTRINGQNQFYIFDVADGISVTFKNIKFINAYKSHGSYSSTFNENVYGASLDIKNSKVTIDNCEFIGNVVSYGSGEKSVYGGAISNFGDLTITNSKFTNNTALSTRGLLSYGGSIYNKGKAILSNTSITGSKSVDFGYGAGIANDGDITLNNCTVSNSLSTHETKGSAIYNTGNCTLTDSIIENNYIERANFNYIYGVIYNSGTLTARGSVFRNNTAYYEAPITAYMGSPNIYNIGNLDLTYNAFIDNNNFYGISSDVYFNGGEIISLDDNWWNTNENPYSTGSKINVDKINSWLIFNITPDYSKLNISDSVTIKASWTNNINLLDKISLLPQFDVTFNTVVDGRTITKTASLVDGQCEFIFNSTQNRGSYDVTASLFTFNQTAIVDVGKLNSNIRFSLNDNITYPDTLFVNVEVIGDDSSSLSGMVLLKIAGKTYNVTLANGKGSFEISGLSPQNYKLNLIYEGNGNYFKAFNTTNVNVKKQDIDLKLNIPEIKVGQKGSAIVTLNTKNVEGQASLYVDGVKKKNVFLYSGNTTITLSNFAEGQYNITLDFVGTEFYNSVRVSGILKVTRYPSSINISVEDIKVGENATVTVKVSPDSLRGEATLIINGINNTIFIDDTVTNVTIADLAAGQYNVTLIFDGDLKYDTVNVSTSFNVLKTPVSLDIVINQDEKNLNGTITVKTSDINCTGVVGVYVNYNVYRMNLTDGKAEFSVKFDKGTNYIFVFYEGNRYFEDATWNTTLGVADEFVFIGENSTGFEGNDFNYSLRLIEINGIPMPGRTVSIDFNGKKYNATTNDDGYAFFKLNLSKGKYSISATYKNITVYNTLTVMEVVFNLTSQNITYGDTLTVEAVFENGVQGNVQFIIGNESVVVEIINATATYTSNSFNAGNYTVRAIYANLTKTTAFNVEKADLNWDIVVGNATPDDDEIVSAINLANATEDIVFIFNKTELKVPITGSQAVLNLSKLPEGRYDLTVKYMGDNNYNPSSTTVSFYVRQSASDIILNVEDQFYGRDISAVAILNDNATGIVRFDVGNLTKEVSIADGKAVWNFRGLDVGNYTLTATYLGNDYYVSSSNSTSFNVKKANSTIELYVNEVSLGENIRIFASLSPNATGSISFSMVGYFSPRNKPVSDSQSYWYIAPMSNGEYTVIAKYLGDNNYYPSNTTFILNVYQKKSILNAEIGDVGKNDRVICRVSLNSKDGEPITSKVTLKIGSSSYSITVRDGSGSLVLGKMAVGNYAYTVDYAGDDNYTAATVGGNFKVVDDLLDVNLTAPDFTKYYGGKTKFKVVLKDSANKPFANQNVYVKIGSGIHYITTDSKGEAFLAINLLPGTYDALVVFEETEKYHSASANSTITVMSTAEGNDVEKLYGSTAQYYAVFTDSNGKVLSNKDITFKISGKSYTVKTLTNGVARINININAGKYTISSVNPVTGQKLINKITIHNRIDDNKDSSNYVGAKTNYKVRLYANSGKPLSAGKEVTFKVNGKSYKVKTDKYGYATLAINLNIGKYTVTATYCGFKVSNKITVKNVLSASDVSVKKSKTTKFSAKLVDSKGKVLSGKQITFKINGKTYTAKTNSKGIATATIKTTLNVGKHIIQSTYGKYKITNTITVKR